MNNFDENRISAEVVITSHTFFALFAGINWHYLVADDCSSSMQRQMPAISPLRQN
jgi:hypothetical protein